MNTKEQLLAKANLLIAEAAAVEIYGGTTQKVEGAKKRLEAANLRAEAYNHKDNTP